MKPHGAVMMFHTASATIQEAIMKAGECIGKNWCVRLSRDLHVLYEQFKAIGGSKVLSSPDTIADVWYRRNALTQEFLEGLLTERDDFRGTMPNIPAEKVCAHCVCTFCVIT